jgi:uncharacterized protein Smg (DUF494 family)
MDIVIKRIENKGIDESGRDPMVSKLLEKGFRLDDIETAMNLVAMMTSRVNPIVTVGEREFNNNGEPNSIRHLHATEAVRLSSAAQKYLLKLVEESAITQLHFEKVIEYLWRNDLRKVSRSRLELILFISRPESETESIEELETSATIIHSIMVH